jgi:hypothetical protein
MLRRATSLKISSGVRTDAAREDDERSARRDSSRAREKERWFGARASLWSQPISINSERVSCGAR